MTPLSARILRAAAPFAAAFGILASGAAQAQTWVPSEDDALLLELRSSGYKLGDSLRGYQAPDGVCVDLADLIQALDLPIRLDKESRRATGWVFAEDQRFVLDREANTVQTVNGNFRVAASAIVDTPEGWCADLGALSRWFGVTLRADTGAMAINLSSERKLPFLEAIERRSRAARLRPPNSGQFDLAQVPRSETPYQAWRTPSIDVQIDAQWQRSGGAHAGYELLASGEALGMSFTARLAGQFVERPDSLRIKAYRYDPEAGLLGPLKATQLAIGDIETQRGGLTANSAFGRGVFVSNRPINRPAHFSVTTLRGALPAGWDAELYRNGQLRAFQADRGDGRYEFSDIELLFGDNDFDIVLYGPQGQTRHERSSMPVGQESIPAGQTWYWAGAVEANRDLIDFSRAFVDPQTGWRWGVGVERGIDRRTSAAIEYQSLILDHRRHNYLEASLRRALGPMLVELSGAQQLGAGQAANLRALGKLGGVRFEAYSFWVHGAYESELVEASQRGEYGLRLSANIPLGSWHLPIEAAASQSRARSGAMVTEWLIRSALRVGRLSLTGELSHRAAAGSNVSSGDAGTRFAILANTMIGRVRLRGEGRFRLDGGKRGLESAKLNAELPLGDDGTLRGAIEHRVDDGRTEATFGYVRQFARFSLRGEGRIDNRGGLGLGLTFGISFGPDPVDGGWRVSRERLAETGQAGVLVFRDENGDGVRQSGESPVEGVELEAGFRHSEKATSADGRAVIDGLRPWVPVLVSIDTGSLPDTLLQPKGRGQVVVPRPGISARVELALAPTGELEGTLLGPDGETLGGVPLELVDGRGQVISAATSDFDGYILFDAIPYGEYRLRVAARSAATLGVRAELGPLLRIDRANASQQLGRLRLELLAGASLASAGSAP